MSKLEQELSILFNTRTPFWEQYYARQNRSGRILLEQEQRTTTPNAQLAWTSRSRYPQFFTVIDAMYYSDPRQQSNYTLIQLSMQACLKGRLLIMCGLRADGIDVMSDALKLLGPVNAPAYRECVERWLI